MDGVAPSHLGLLSPLCRSRRLCGGATLTSERQGPLSQGRTVLYATRPKPSAQLIRATRSRTDIPVNNAGSAPGGVLDFLTEEHWAQSLQLKFMRYVRCLKHVLPIMQKQGRGRVVNLIGNDGVKPSYWEIAPGAANATGQNLTLALAAQYGKDSISFRGADRRRCGSMHRCRAAREVCV